MTFKNYFINLLKYFDINVSLFMKKKEPQQNTMNIFLMDKSFFFLLSIAGKLSFLLKRKKIPLKANSFFRQM